MMVEEIDLSSTWPAGRAAKELGISPKVLRDWDSRGWLRLSGLRVIRTPTGRRRFIPAEVEEMARKIKRGEIRFLQGAVQVMEDGTFRTIGESGAARAHDSKEAISE